MAYRYCIFSSTEDVRSEYFFAFEMNFRNFVIIYSISVTCILMVEI